MSLLSCVTAFAQTTYHVFYLGGQSNMEGFGYVDELPEALNTPVEGVPVFHGKTGVDNGALGGYGLWRTLKPGHGTGFTTDGTSNTYSNRFGPELTFARALQAAMPDKAIALIKYEQGGSSIDTLAAGQFGAWDPDFVGKNGINQYDHFLASVRNAFAVEDIDGDGIRDTLIPAGVLWMQGESDAAFSVETALAYEANLKRLMDLIRAAFRSDDLPVVVGLISESGNAEDGKLWTYGHIVRQAQASYVAKDPHAALVTSTDSYSYSDPWHYDTAGYIDLGRQFARAMLPFLEK